MSEENETTAAPPAFESELHEGRGRFLAHAIEHAFLVGRRRPEDFVRHFPPHAIMEGLRDQPSLRARILAETTGIKPRIAAKKTWESAADDLAIALKEGETNATTVISVFSPDDRIRYLSPTAIWTFLTEGDFWTATPGTKEHEMAKEHLAFLITRALRDGLISHRSVVEGIQVAEMSQRLPKVELGKIIEGALAAGQEKKPFTEVELLAAMPASVLVQHIPLSHLWDRVVAPRVADVHGYTEKEPEVAPLLSEPPPAADAGGNEEKAAESQPTAAVASAKEPAGPAAANASTTVSASSAATPKNGLKGSGAGRASAGAKGKAGAKKQDDDEWLEVSDGEEAPRSTEHVISEDDFA